MTVTIAVVLSVCVSAVAVYLAFRWQVSLNETMRRVAAELGMSYGGGSEAGPEASSGIRAFLRALAPWRMEGRRGNVAIVCYPFTRGSGRSNTTYTVVEAFHPAPLDLGLTVGKETMLTRLGAAVLHLQDITVGSEQFDSAARVKGADPARIAALLSAPGVQESILRLLEYAPLATVTDKAARLEKQGTIKDAATYREIIELLAAVVEAISAARARG